MRELAVRLVPSEPSPEREAALDRLSFELLVNAVRREIQEPLGRFPYGTFDDNILGFVKAEAAAEYRRQIAG